ncbi:MAG: glycosyltransferase [Candidatus Micrarchaeota archaeon]|nr:glycosyltransferase [Candidatus Micrarchaeota archaeon]
MNEKGTIAGLIGALRKLYAGATIIVADDGSTDGTRGIVKAISEADRNVLFLDRRKRNVKGLTASVVDSALRTLTEKIVVMDGDLQHPPEVVGDIYGLLDANDIVVGVRTSVKDWGVHRKVISKTMAYIAYATFKARGRPTTNDIMSGFFGIRAGLFKRIALSHRESFVHTGYKVLLDILRLAPANVRIGEVYYSTFHLRRSGTSKLNYKRIVDTVVSTFR